MYDLTKTANQYTEIHDDYEALVKHASFLNELKKQLSGMVAKYAPRQYEPMTEEAYQAWKRMIASKPSAIPPYIRNQQKKQLQKNASHSFLF